MTKQIPHGGHHWCGEKRSYETRDAAEKHMRELIAKDIKRGLGAPEMRIYRCPDCKLLHVGHVSLGKRMARALRTSKSTKARHKRHRR